MYLLDLPSLSQDLRGGTNGVVEGLHAFFHMAIVSLRRQGIWKMAGGAADAQESQFYEVEVSGPF